jgi:hypothetical protein
MATHQQIPSERTNTLNPYGGCGRGQRVADGQGCLYYNVRTTPAGPSGPGPWGDCVAVKVNVPDLLRLR